MTRIALLASHAVAEYDDVRMFHDAGFEVFAPGGYENPAHNGEGIRPALPQVPYYADLAAAVNRVRAERGDPGEMIDWGKAALPDEVIDWADVIIVHHFVERWIGWQWDRIRHKRVIWRTCGQSNPDLERFMASFRREGLEIVRYSPAERRYFETRGTFAGEDAVIRFGKYPDDYGPWIGDVRAVGNVTQEMPARGDACGLGFWQAATAGLPVRPAGKGSEAIGGVGMLSYADMLDYLRHIRAYLYTGTRPASYTLGLIEAMLSGVPVVSIGPRAWGGSWGAPDLFDEAIAHLHADSPTTAQQILAAILDDEDYAEELGAAGRARAVRLFGIETIAAQWQEFLA